MSSIINADYILIDNKKLEQYILKTFRNKSIYIPYGVSIPEPIPWDEFKLLTKINRHTISSIIPGKFWLVVARLEPENNISLIIDSFIIAGTKYPLVVVGDFTNTKYKAMIYRRIQESKTSDKIFLLGSIYNLNILNMLRQNCFAYIHGHSVGGTNPSLLEAMAMKTIIIAHDNEFNRDVCNNSALYFKNVNDLTDKIKQIEYDVEDFVKLRYASYDQVRDEYNWDNVIECYAKLLKML